MLDAFKEFLDGMYWEGYAEGLEDENPSVFYSQYREIKANYSLPI